MKVTYNWLKDFVEIRVAPEILAEKLTMAGLEVTALEEKEGDWVFEIEVTANRPDCLSVIGIGREVAAILNTKHKTQNAKWIPHFRKCKNSLKIEIKDKKDCPLYHGWIIKEVKVGLSPEWLKKRLELIGCRSVNNIVDITNYILFTWGQPLHAFDLDKLSSSQIIVRRAHKEEKLTTIDGIERILTPEFLVIADQDKAIALAGVMGGEDAEVTASTKNVLLEAAVFNPIVIRRARQKLGLQSESAYRFERGVDLDKTELVASRAAELIEKLSQGKYWTSQSAGKTKSPKKSINLSVAQTQDILGVKVNAANIKRILDNLAFKVKKKNKDGLMVEVPAHRPDVNLAIDLIEEIARIFGYACIPTTLPKVKPFVTPFDARGFVSLIKDILVGLGLNEVITYSLMAREALLAAPQDSCSIEILNPQSTEQEILRPTLIPALLRCLTYNLNQKQEYLSIFEIANVFSQSENKVKEETVLGIALCGEKSLLLEQGLIKDRVSILHLKGILETLFNRLGIRDYNFQNTDNADEAGVFLNKERIGLIRKAQKKALEKAEIKNQDVFVLEIFLEKVFAQVNLEKKFAAPPLYPGILRDISFILRDEIRVDEILEAVKKRGGVLLRQAKISDYYRGKQIPPSFKGLTISCLYRSDERTLTEDEINPIHQLVVAVLEDRFNVKIR